VAPLVSYEVRNKRIYKELTPNADHFLTIIAKYAQPKFKSSDELRTYALNILSDSGTHIFISDLRTVTLKKGESPIGELISKTGDI
jgi:hypothetical protein